MDDKTWMIIALAVLIFLYINNANTQTPYATRAGYTKSHAMRPNQDNGFTLDPISFDVARDGVSMNEIQNTQVKYVV